METIDCPTCGGNTFRRIANNEVVEQQTFSTGNREWDFAVIAEDTMSTTPWECVNGCDVTAELQDAIEEEAMA
jgi:predicted  nucleic acid-binding Zn-ribbon protein